MAKYYNGQALPHDDNDLPIVGGIDSTDSSKVLPIEVNPDTGRLLTEAQGLTVGVDFDYLSVSNTDTDQDTLTWKIGGSGGTTVRTLVVGYAPSASKISDDIASLDYS